MRAKILVVLLLIGVLTFALREIACVAGERTPPAAPMASIETLLSDAAEPDLPAAPEIDVGTVAHPVLTF